MILFIKQVCLIHEKIVGWFCEIHESDIPVFYEFLLNSDFSLYEFSLYTVLYLFYKIICVLYIFFLLHTTFQMYGVKFFLSDSDLNE